MLKFGKIIKLYIIVYILLFLIMYNKYNGRWWVVKKLYLYGFIIVTKIVNWICVDLIKLLVLMLIYGLKEIFLYFLKIIIFIYNYI